jgi:hypothetical protein
MEKRTIERPDNCLQILKPIWVKEQTYALVLYSNLFPFQVFLQCRKYEPPGGITRFVDA